MPGTYNTTSVEPVAVEAEVPVAELVSSVSLYSKVIVEVLGVSYSATEEGTIIVATPSVQVAQDELDPEMSTSPPQTPAFQSDMLCVNAMSIVFDASTVKLTPSTPLIVSI